MFGISLPELMIIAAVAVVMFGPERLPELARSAARLVQNLRQLATKTQDDLRRELGPEFSNLSLSDLDPRQAIRRHVLDGLETDLTGSNTSEAAPGKPPPFDIDAT